MWVYACVCKCPWRPEDAGPCWAEVTGSYELPDMGAGNQIWSSEREDILLATKPSLQLLFSDCEPATRPVFPASHDNTVLFI